MRLHLTAGLEASELVVFANGNEMYPGQNLLVLVYNTRAMDEAGELAGERFMVAYLRGVRDYIDAYYLGQGRESMTDILVKHTLVKDREIYPKMRPNWADPNGRVKIEPIVTDAGLYVRWGIMKEMPDLTNTYVGKYADYAVQQLGEYQPPR